jgi:hypothetical protein
MTYLPDDILLLLLMFNIGGRIKYFYLDPQDLVSRAKKEKIGKPHQRVLRLTEYAFSL